MMDQDEMLQGKVVSGRFERSETLGAIAKAKAQAQAKFTSLGKDKTADIATRTGGKYSYSYADLATCLDAVIPALSEVGIALFQPVRVEPPQAIATTLLVHESGEWLSGDFAVAIVDPTDARSIGSAATYARRYGLLSMLGYASSDEDDDGQEARGGDHEPAQSKQVCPACGKVGTIIKGSAQYGGGWVCWKRRDGCGTKWPEGPFPTTAPLDEAEAPRQRVLDDVPKEGAAKPRAAKSAPKAAIRTDQAERGSSPAEVANGRGPAGAQVGEPSGQAATAAPVNPPQGADVPPPVQPRIASEPDRGPGIDHPDPDDDMDGQEPEVPQTFTIGRIVYTTKGFTEEQTIESFRLFPAVDKIKGARYCTGLMNELFGVESRKDLTQAQGEILLRKLYSIIAPKSPSAA
jgi:hypothetical protein